MHRFIVRDVIGYKWLRHIGVGSHGHLFRTRSKDMWALLHSYKYIKSCSRRGKLHISRTILHIGNPFRTRKQTDSPQCRGCVEDQSICNPVKLGEWARRHFFIGQESPNRSNERGAAAACTRPLSQMVSPSHFFSLSPSRTFNLRQVPRLSQCSGVGIARRKRDGQPPPFYPSSCSRHPRQHNPVR